jgi:hypothetical protein
MLTEELALLGLDLQSALGDDPRFLHDATFLGSLHVELHGRLGEEDARAALMQLGFLHGLRDALRLVARGLGGGTTGPQATPSSTRLATRMHADGAVSGLQVRGQWPDQTEATAVGAARGARDRASCHVSSGYTSGWLSGIFGADLLVVEADCHAAGSTACSFVAREPAAWADLDDPAGRAQLDALPFARLRDHVERHLAAAPVEEEDELAFESGSPVIHVWGPVMVVPFAGPDEALQALELIGRDPGARDVRVVVVDLAGVVIDDGFGASALEQILDAVETWGAEPLLTGISPLSEPVVADLERNHLLVRKDLPAAIATAFQIAEAQRRSS